MMTQEDATREKAKYLSNLSEYEGLSLRAIEERSGHHFNTVKNMWTRRTGIQNANREKRV
ncbi:hypothetical protein FACS1894105_14570 [Clostridia bacterium]|nr:hypothetical protein FACS1894105_14570 [Clostridia bacterium]